ncbi:Protein of unknown function [Pyronema omphalodes CBS 100304]|uniref:Uncharacterized protein n=1 Tax=Pyronema omphalodes (strain CBS 100304) TaxID=1076935 RepID=U4LAF9_PYROM|nr:Protein of unknown function [Pyronema omphalodes CBS 100304]
MVILLLLDTCFLCVIMLFLLYSCHCVLRYTCILTEKVLEITQLSIDINLVLGISSTVINSQNDGNLYFEFLGPSGYTCLNSQLPFVIVAAKKTTSPRST